MNSLLHNIRHAYKSVRISYSDLKIKNKFYIIFSLIILIALSVSLLVMQVTFNIYNELLYKQAAQVLNLSSANIEDYIKRIQNLSYSIISAPDIQKYAEGVKNGDSDYEKSFNMTQLMNQLTAYSFDEPDISSINYIDIRNKQYWCGSMPIEISYNVQDYIVEKALAAQGKDIILEPMGADSSVMVARIIRQVPGFSLDYLGTFVIRCDIGKFIRHYISSSVNNHPELTILSGSNLIYSSQELADGEGKNLTFKNDTGYEIKMLNGSKYFVAHYISRYTGWTYISMIPYNGFFEEITIVRYIVLIGYFLIFLLTVFIGFKFARNITKPLEKLTFKMKRVENGNFEIGEAELVQHGRQDEIGQLQTDFEIMIRKIDMLIKEDYIKQIAMKDAQWMALQAQINPHFLYNTLESINWMAKVNKQQDISKMVEALGTLMRGAISSRDKVITIEEEIRLLESYMTIQKLRYDDRLDFQLTASDEFRAVKIPKLTLQPIVENSINYGLENMLCFCIIKVDFIRKYDQLDIVIEDNGPGIKSDILKRLKTGEVKTKGSGIGLKNIDDRLKLIFGEKYGVTVFSEAGFGTKVTVSIPIEAEE